MIVVETNVLSESMRIAPDRRVTEWLDAQPLETLYLSIVTVAELRYGVARLPTGKRRQVLHERIETQVLPGFAGRILPFDLAATRTFAAQMAKAQSDGISVALSDAYIAAIASAHGMTIATRDITPFRAVGVSVIDPWKS